MYPNPSKRKRQVSRKPRSGWGFAFAVQPHREVRPESRLAGIAEHVIVNPNPASRAPPDPPSAGFFNETLLRRSFGVNLFPEMITRMVLLDSTCL